MRKESMKKQRILKNKGITLIALVVTIVVLLILAGVSISMLAGENGIIRKAQESKDKTEKAEVEEQVRLAIMTSRIDGNGQINIDTLKKELEKIGWNGEVTGLPTEGTINGVKVKIEEDGTVKVEEGTTTGGTGDKLYNTVDGMSEEELIEEAEKNTDIFIYEVIDDAEMGATEYASLPTKTARITGLKPEYCNQNGIRDEENEELVGYYEIYRDGEVLTDTLVIPNQVEISGELYKVTEVSLVTEANDWGSRGTPNVKTIIYPNTVEKIYQESWVGQLNTVTETIIIPDNLKIIGDEAFCCYSSLKSITIPTSVTSIGNDAFCDCDSLTSITIPTSVTSIGSFAFCSCDSLTSITIPTSVTSIDSGAFYGCTGLTSVSMPENMTSIGSQMFQGCDSLTNITIPTSVTSIGSQAFEDCDSLTNITIPTSVTSIGSHAFSGCSSLTSINIPTSVTSIGSSAFSRCNSLTTINIPSSVTSIEGTAFSGCSSLTSINIPSSVTSIGSSAFSDCSGLKSVNIPTSVTSIGQWAFSRCTGLTNITIPSNVTQIEYGTFLECTGLTSITIPTSVTSIGDRAFYKCSNLKTVNYRGTSQQWNNITKGKYDNTSLTNATINYNYTGE